MTNTELPPLMIAVITGGHDFEVPEFIQLFRSMPGVDFYPQALENFASDLSGVRERYDALVFYNMHAEPPTPKAKAVLESLGEQPQGLVFLHHALLAYPRWEPMGEILGMQDRSFTYWHGEQIRVEIADPTHPVTRGLSSWDMVDETYLMPSTGLDSQILLTTEHPKSMKTLAWTRIYKKARVFAFASGHDREAFTNPNFRTVLHRGIAWAAGKI
jgi:uncharacterized protein